MNPSGGSDDFVVVACADVVSVDVMAVGILAAVSWSVCVSKCGLVLATDDRFIQDWLGTLMVGCSYTELFEIDAN